MVSSRLTCIACQLDSRLFFVQSWAESQVQEEVHREQIQPDCCTLCTRPYRLISVSNSDGADLCNICAHELKWPTVMRPSIAPPACMLELLPSTSKCTLVLSATCKDAQYLDSASMKLYTTSLLKQPYTRSHEQSQERVQTHQKYSMVKIVMTMSEQFRLQQVMPVPPLFGRASVPTTRVHLKLLLLSSQ